MAQGKEMADREEELLKTIDRCPYAFLITS
jgi:hypothetical protein